MTTVYIVVSGEYSDFDIHRVYLDGAQAEVYAMIQNKRRGVDDFRVWDMDTSDDMPADDPVAGGIVKGFRGIRYYSGDVGAYVSMWGVNDPEMRVREVAPPSIAHLEIFIPFSAAKDDRDIAKKIAQDRFAQWDAAREGIT